MSKSYITRPLTAQDIESYFNEYDGRMQRRIPPSLQNIPKAPEAPAPEAPAPRPVCLSAREAVAFAKNHLENLRAQTVAAEELLEQQQQKEAEAAAHQAHIERIEYERSLAGATSEMLTSIYQYLRNPALTHITPSSELAKFRKELQPLANSHGYKIVRVGDGTRAMLVKTR